MKKFLIICLFACISCFSGKLLAQVKIGNNPTTIGSGSLLELESTTKGLVLPRMTGAQMNAIASPIAGMFIYNTDSSCICQYMGSAWRSLCGGNIGSPYNDWHVIGNGGTVDGTNFLGTTDNIPFSIRVNNQKSGRIDHLLNNSFFGFQSGNAITTGTGNSFYGFGAGKNNTTGSANTFVGDSAGFTNTANSNNHFIGYQSGYNNIGGNNHFEGYQAGFSNTTGINNLFVGHKAGYNNLTGNANVFMGYLSGYSSSASNNVFIGDSSGYNNTTGTPNLFIGFNTGFTNTTGGENVFLGHRAGFNNTTGGNNTFIGVRAGYANTTGNRNTAVGEYASSDNTTGIFNSSFGYSAGGSCTTGSYNTSIGERAGYNNLISSSITALGYSAGFANTADNNTFIGTNSGFTITTGANNTFLGYGADASIATLTNATAIGYNAIVGSSNSLVLGSNVVNVGIGTANPSAKLDLVGSIKIADGTQGAGKVLTSDASGLASWSSSSTMGYRTLVTKSSDQVLNSVVWSDITGLSFPLTAGITYRFYATIAYTATATTEGIDLAINGPASPTFLAYTVRQSNGNANEYISYFTTYDGVRGITNSIIAGNIAIITGIITPSASGTLTIRYIEEAANKHTLKAGSTLEYW